MKIDWDVVIAVVIGGVIVKLLDKFFLNDLIDKIGGE